MKNKDKGLTSGLKIIKGVAQPDTINILAINKHKSGKPTEFDVQQYVDGILLGNRMLLSRAITLIESSLSDHHILARQILDKCLPYSGRSIRIGITGIPGVGKSTFIEALGSSLIKEGKKVAVLAVDPSSSKSGAHLRQPRSPARRGRAGRRRQRCGRRDDASAGCRSAASPARPRPLGSAPPRARLPLRFVRSLHHAAGRRSCRYGRGRSAVPKAWHCRNRLLCGKVIQVQA